jgi:hypothetical protein
MHLACRIFQITPFTLHFIAFALHFILKFAENMQAKAIFALNHLAFNFSLQVIKLPIFSRNRRFLVRDGQKCTAMTVKPCNNMNRKSTSIFELCFLFKLSYICKSGRSG